MRARAFWVSATLVLALLGLHAGGCRIRTSGENEGVPPPLPCSSTPAPVARGIVQIFPSEVHANGQFNVQPNGRSALAVEGTGFTRRDRIYWADTRLVTTFAGPTLLTGYVPKEMLSKPGEVVISVRDPVFIRATELQATFRVLEAQ